jgi:hypothetical protein
MAWWIKQWDYSQHFPWASSTLFCAFRYFLAHTTTVITSAGCQQKEDTLKGASSLACMCCLTFEILTSILIDLVEEIDERDSVFLSEQDDFIVNAAVI